MTNKRPSVCLIGEIAAEFADSVALLRKTADVHCFSSPEEAATALSANGFVPDVCIALQAWTGQFSPNQWQSLQRTAPLLRIVAVLGACSEGELRSGREWQGLIRIPAHRFPIWWRRQLQRIAAGGAPAWSLPLTAEKGDILLLLENQQGPISAPLSLESRSVAIVTRIRPTAEALTEIFRQHGHIATWITPESAATLADADLVVWDVADLERSDLTALRQFIQSRPTTHVAALVHFPRAEDIERLRALGVQAVFAQPLLVDELLECVEESRASSPGTPRGMVRRGS